MKNELRLISPELCEEQTLDTLKKLMYPYVRELDEHQGKTTPPQIVERFTESILRMLTDRDRILLLYYVRNEAIGFGYGKVDRAEHKGVIRPGWGYIMEFYIVPQYRRGGYGTRLYRELERRLCERGVRALYLTADPVTGVPFWQRMGYGNSGLISSENQLYIYEKRLLDS